MRELRRRSTSSTTRTTPAHPAPPPPPPGRPGTSWSPRCTKQGRTRTSPSTSRSTRIRYRSDNSFHRAVLTVVVPPSHWVWRLARVLTTSPSRRKSTGLTTTSCSSSPTGPAVLGPAEPSWWRTTSQAGDLWTTLTAGWRNTSAAPALSQPAGAAWSWVDPPPGTAPDSGGQTPSVISDLWTTGATSSTPRSGSRGRCPRWRWGRRSLREVSTPRTDRAPTSPPPATQWGRPGSRDSLSTATAPSAGRPWTGTTPRGSTTVSGRLVTIFQFIIIFKPSENRNPVWAPVRSIISELQSRSRNIPAAI